MQKTYFLLSFIFFISANKAHISIENGHCEKNQKFYPCCYEEKRCPNAGPPSNFDFKDAGCRCIEGYARDFDENCVPSESCFFDDNSNGPYYTTAVTDGMIKKIVLIQQQLNPNNNEDEKQKMEKEIEENRKQLQLLTAELINQRNKLGSKNDEEIKTRKELDELLAHLERDHKTMDELRKQKEGDTETKLKDYENKMKQIENLKLAWEKQAEQKMEKLRQEKEELEKKKAEHTSKLQKQIDLINSAKHKLITAEKELNCKTEACKKCRLSGGNFNTSTRDCLCTGEYTNAGLGSCKKKVEQQENNKDTERDPKCNKTCRKCRLSGGTFDDYSRYCICTGQYQNADTESCKAKRQTEESPTSLGKEKINRKAETDKPCKSAICRKCYRSGGSFDEYTQTCICTGEFINLNLEKCIVKDKLKRKNNRKD